MGLCFVGKRHFGSFISQYLPDSPGEVVNLEDGRTVGKHRGRCTMHSNVVYYCILHCSGDSLQPTIEFGFTDFWVDAPTFIRA